MRARRAHKRMIARRTASAAAERLVPARRGTPRRSEGTPSTGAVLAVLGRYGYLCDGYGSDRVFAFDLTTGKYTGKVATGNGHLFLSLLYPPCSLSYPLSPLSLFPCFVLSHPQGAMPYGVRHANAARRVAGVGRPLARRAVPRPADRARAAAWAFLREPRARRPTRAERAALERAALSQRCCR